MNLFLPLHIQVLACYNTFIRRLVRHEVRNLYKIKPRRRKLRVNNPVAFGILCAMIVVLIIGGIYALAVGEIGRAHV